MKTNVLIFLLSVSCSLFASNPLTIIPQPTPAQLTWQESELVAVFHYDLHVFDGKKYNQTENRITPIPDYNIFDPKQLDTDQWIRAAKSMGAKIAIITATHETGFALYQSDVNPYCTKALKWRDGNGDVVRDFVNSCHKYGILPGIYIGIRWNAFFGVHDFEVLGDSSKLTQNRRIYYNKMCEGMTKELMTRYGDLAIVWFDGGAHGPEMGGPNVLPIVEKYQKNCIFYHNSQRADIRWGGSESGTVPYPCWGTYPFPYSHSQNQKVVYKDNFKLLKEGDPNGKYYMPAMSDAPLVGEKAHDWFWEAGNQKYLYSLQHLMDMYCKSVGHNTSLILGLTPDNRGLLPDAQVERLKEFGDEIHRRFSHPIISTSSQKKLVVLNLPHLSNINQVVLQEDIRLGERVRKYTLEVKQNGKWVLLSEGSCIGHKHIVTFDPIEVSAVRLKIKKSLDTPQIKVFSVGSY